MSLLPKREEFILDVRRASRTEQMPVIATDPGLMNSSGIERMLARAALWLTPQIVENFDPADFHDWSSAQQTELSAAVIEFQAIASQVASDRPATDTQFKEGFAAFQRLKAAVAKPVLAEWQHAADQLLAQLQTWAAEFQWRTRRKDKQLQESLLGEYKLEQLLVYADDELFVCDPLARFTPNSLGAFDFSIQPSYDRNSVYREFDGSWMIRLASPSHGLQSCALDKEAFHQSLESLRALQ